MMKSKIKADKFDFWGTEQFYSNPQGDAFFYPRKVRSFGILLTKRCPLKCKHCFVNKKATDFSFKGLSLLLNKIVEKKEFNAVVFTGGEPFFVFAKLKKAVRDAKKKKLFVGVVTSGYWATSQAKAEDYLKTLKGLDILAVSLDKYHQEQIPLKNIEYLLAASRELGVKVLLKVIVSGKGNLRMYNKLSEKYSCNYQVQNISLKGPRNKDLFADAKFNRGINLRSKFCDIRSPYVDVNGDVFYCCAPGGLLINKEDNFLYLGNIYEGAINSNFNERKRKKIDRFVGQDKISFFRNLKNAGVKLSGKYYCKCDICYDLVALNKDNKYLISQVS